jgi:pilus assembly protein CpaB
MMKRVIPFVFSGVMGLVAVLMMNSYLKQQARALELEKQKLAAQAQSQVEVIIARQDIPEGATLNEDQLAYKLVPQPFLQPHAASRPADVLGFVTKVPIAEGEQILGNKLLRPDEPQVGATLATLTPKGKRAVTVAVDALSGVGGFVRPGDTVDVLWTVQVPHAQGRGTELVTVTIFQGVTVLAIGSQMVGQTTRAQAAGKKEGGPTTETATMALTPQEATLLLFAREQGRIHLSLRPRADKDEQVVVQPGNMSTVMETVFGKPLEVGEAPKPQWTVEVFKGLERSVVAVDPMEEQHL